MKPLVTIAIPTCDRPQYLREALASALAQTYDNIEIVICDDSTSDETGEGIAAIAASDRRIRYRRNPQKLGMAANFNALADEARGEFISIVSDDDRLLPDFTSRLVHAIQPAARVAFSNHYLINSRGERLAKESLEHTRRYHRDKLPAGEIANVERTVWLNSVPISAALMRTKDLRRLRFREELDAPELELFARMAAEDAGFVFVPEYLTEYRTHPLSNTATGIRSEKLVPRLLDLPVSPEVEIYKRQFMEPLLVDAIGRCLQQGDMDLARRFWRSKYYPRVIRRRDRQEPNYRKADRRADNSCDDSQITTRDLRQAVHACVQRICLTLPAALGSPVYRLMRQIKSGINF
jgi:glycosyltransferase involved in cell wall biosynthesis